MGFGEKNLAAKNAAPLTSPSVFPRFSSRRDRNDHRSGCPWLLALEQVAKVERFASQAHPRRGVARAGRLRVAWGAIRHALESVSVQGTKAMVDKSAARVQQMFREIAPKYDRMNHLLSLNIDRHWRRRTIRAVPPVGGRPILDVCTGTGDLALAYARRCEASQVVGADFCPEMLEIAEQKREAAKLAPDKLRFVEADAQSLPFEDNTFQIVAVAFGLRNVTDTDRGLSEMTRVCHPQGRVAVLEFSQPRWQPFRGLYGLYFRHVLPRVGQWLARNDQEAYAYLPESVGEFPAGEALCQRMRAAGLVDVTARSLTLGVATLYVGTKPGEETDGRPANP